MGVGQAPRLLPRAEFRFGFDCLLGRCHGLILARELKRHAGERDAEPGQDFTTEEHRVGHVQNFKSVDEVLVAAAHFGQGLAETWH